MGRTYFDSLSEISVYLKGMTLWLGQLVAVVAEMTPLAQMSLAQQTERDWD